MLDCKGSTSEAESSNVSVEAVGFCRDSSFPLAATGNLDGVLCIWDISRGVSTGCSCTVILVVGTAIITPPRPFTVAVSCRYLSFCQS
jgi:hypothetical protein